MLTPSKRKTPAKKAAPRKPLGVHDYLFPHKGNKYKPHIFRTASLTAIVVGLVVLQGVYLTQTNFVFPKTNFLAAVLPSALISLTNTDRSASNLAPVTEDATLDEAAQNVANDMAAKGYFAHVSPQGQSPWYWLQAVGYKYSFAGENLAVNFSDSDQVESAWMQSPTHRANIEKPEYTKIGIGVANGEFQGKDVTFVAEFFATPPAGGEGSPAPAGEPPVQEGAPATVPTSNGSKAQIAVTQPSATTPTASQAAAARTKAAIASEVLGTQTTQSAPVSAVTAPTPASQATPTALTPQVASAAPSPVDFAAQVATSPTQTLLYILGALAVIVAILLIIELSVKARLKYLEMTGGGLALLALIILLLVFNVFTAPRVLITNDSQPAQTSTNGS